MRKKSILKLLSFIVITISIGAVIVFLTLDIDLSPDDSSASINSSIDPRFGMGVATRAGTPTDDYGYSIINQNTRDSISYMGLNSKAKTWSVYQLENNTDINFLLTSFNYYQNYDQYDRNTDGIADGYNVNDPWNYYGSSNKGVPGVSTFIVTHITIVDSQLGCSTQNNANGYSKVSCSSCGDDGYCIYGLSTNPDAWGQDSNQVGGKYLDKPTDCNKIPNNLKQYFTGCTNSNYNPIGLISIPGKDLLSEYPNYMNASQITDIRVPQTYWRDVVKKDDMSGVFITYGGFYNPTNYKGKNYSKGAFYDFLDKNPNTTLALFNFPNAKASKWDSNPILPESYSYLLESTVRNNILNKYPNIKIISHLGAEDDRYPLKIQSYYKTNYPNKKAPISGWGTTMYGNGTEIQNDFSTEYANKTLYNYARVVENRVKFLNTLDSSVFLGNDIYLLEVTTTASSSNSSKWLNSEIYSNPYSQEYKWEKYVHESFGNWLTSLSAKYPNLIYYSLQPTFAQPELLTYLYFPSTRKVDYGRQILSNTATGTANGWYSAAQSGGAPAYIHLNGSQTIGDTTFISVSYYDADGVSDKSEGINLAQIVVNDYVDWDGPKVNSSSTKEGIRIMYSNLGDSNFEPNSVYIYQHGCTSGCIYGWKKVNKNSNLTISSSLNVIAQISYVKTTRDELKITFVIKDPSNKFGNSNLYAWTEGRISGKSTNFSENFDLLSGYSTQPDVNNLVYKDARFKYLGKI